MSETSADGAVQRRARAQGDGLEAAGTPQGDGPVRPNASNARPRQGQAAPAPPAQEDGGLFGGFKGILQWIVIWMLIQQFMGFFGNKAPPQQLDADGKPVPQTAPVNARQLRLAWPVNAETDLAVYLSPDFTFDWSAPTYTTRDQSAHQPSRFPWLVLDAPGVRLGDYSDERLSTVEVVLDAHLAAHNGSLYAHVFMTRAGRSPNTTRDEYDEDATAYMKKLLTRFGPRRKVAKLKSLISSSDSSESFDPSGEIPWNAQGDVEPMAVPEPEPPADAEDTTWVAYWHPNLTLAVVPEDQTLQIQALPPPIAKNVVPTPDGQHYFPILYANDFWLMHEHMTVINKTVKSVPLRVDFYQTANWKYMLYMTMDESFRAQEAMAGANSRSEVDEIKRMLIETNPILLGVTMVVTMLHSLFDMLAFKNDIQFWRARKDLEGLSLRTILTNIVVQGIIFLYLLDNETSWVVIISSGVGAVIEVWKVHKAVIVERTPGFPFINIKERVTNKRVTKTQEYDKIAFRYLSYAFAPLMVGYAIYSLVYEQHKSWYSYILGTAVGFVYTFGFITMIPQLYINYRLKSVAHMPWKTFGYKALNTFIDDLFAFIIKMPTLHRLACFRDDIVFFILLFQMWKYPVDKRRRNEFGQVGEEGAAEGDDEEDVDDKLLAEIEAKEKLANGGTAAGAASTAGVEGKKDK